MSTSRIVVGLWVWISFLVLHSLLSKSLKICCPNLKHIEVYRMHLKSLDISGTRLEKLEVWFCFALVNIFAPNLQSFSWIFSGITARSSIQSFPMLTKFFLSILDPCITRNKIDHSSVVNLLSASSQVKDFDIFSGFLRILSDIYFELGDLPFSFMNLKTLRIRGGIKQRYIPGLACLLKSSPVVHTLEIMFSEEDGKWNNKSMDDANCTQEQYWESQVQYLSPFLSHLNVAEICLDKMIPESAITFAKFVLKYGKNMQKMRVFDLCGNYLPPNSLSDTIALIKGFPRACRYTRFSSLSFR